MEILIKYGVLVVLAVIVCAVWGILETRREAKRRGAFERAAAAAGWLAPQYSDAQKKFEELRGQWTLTANPIVAPDGSRALFDYTVTRKPMGSSRWRYDVVQTVVYVRFAEPSLFDEIPDAETRRYLMNNSGVTVNGTGNEVFIFREGNLAGADQVVEFVAWGEAIARMFEREAS
jgi:hypothetical protein